MERSSFQDDNEENHSSSDIGVNAYGSIVAPDEEPESMETDELEVIFRFRTSMNHDECWKRFLARSVITLLGVFLSMTIHIS